MSAPSTKPVEPLGSNFSLARVLSPIPCSRFHVVANVLALVHEDLAVPVLRAALAEADVQLVDEEVANVLWKLKTYLPSCFCLQHAVGHLPASLKKLQALDSNLTLVLATTSSFTCNRCPGAVPVLPCTPVDRSTVNQNLKSPTLCENRYRMFSFTAGIQNASFQEARCPQCRAYFCAGWRYDKGAYGRLTGMSFHPELAPADFFVVPKTRSWDAVDVQMLQHLTAELVHGGSSFSAAMAVWATQHKEPTQHNAIYGPDYTLIDNTREYLEVAWFAWQVLSRGGEKVQQMDWSFTDAGLEKVLLACLDPLREAHLARICKHVETCPRCDNYLLLLVDGKQGARRFICAGLEGTVDFPDFGVSLLTGCLRHAHPKSFFCSCCRPAKMMQTALIPQTAVASMEEVRSSCDSQPEMRYLVDCHDPDTKEMFQALLPRAEVRADLLQEYETSLLPGRQEHRNKKARTPWIKGARQRLKWARQSEGVCAMASGKIKAKASAKTRPRTKPPAVLSKSSRQPKLVKTRVTCPDHRESKASKKPSRPVATGWLADCGAIESACGIEKHKEVTRRRRCTGGVLTAVTTCGLLADWMELWRGESLELVYLFLLRLYKDLRDISVTICALGYDNACKLRSLALAKVNAAEPWTKDFVEHVAIVLDRFHKRNHTWCLKNMPEVDPSNPINEAFTKGKNTEACEELNSWISCRTGSSLELSQGRFGVYWWTLFSEHNDWLEARAQARRRRFALGVLSRNPDEPRVSVAE